MHSWREPLMSTSESAISAFSNGRLHGPDVIDGRRLVVMSNRAPIKITREHGEEKIEPTVGGVGSTFLRLLERNGGLWIAWSGGPKNPAPRLMPADKPRLKIIFA